MATYPHKPTRLILSTFIFLLIGLFFPNSFLDAATITMKSKDFSVGYLEQHDKPVKALKTNPGYDQKIVGVSRFLELMNRYDDLLIESIKTNFHNGSSIENQMASDIEVILYMPDSVTIDDVFDHRLEFIFSSRKTRQITKENQWNYWLIKCNFSYSRLAVLEGYDDGFYGRIYNDDLKEKYKSYHTGYVKGEADRKAQKEHRGLQHTPAPR